MRHTELLLATLTPSPERALQEAPARRPCWTKTPTATALHAEAIDTLAKDTGRPVQEVAEVYMRELARLESGARIFDYLPLLTSRYALTILRERVRQGSMTTVSSRPMELA
jgi:hypothetical protein